MLRWLGYTPLLRTVHILFSGLMVSFSEARLLYFSKSTLSKNSFRNMIRVSNSLYPDQTRHFVEPDLGPKVFLRLSAEDKVVISIQSHEA